MTTLTSKEGHYIKISIPLQAGKQDPLYSGKDRSSILRKAKQLQKEGMAELISFCECLRKLNKRWKRLTI